LPPAAGNRPAGNRPWIAKRPAGRPQGTAVPFRSGPNRTGPPAARSGPPRSGPPEGSERGPAGGPNAAPGRSRSYDRPRPGGFAKSRGPSGGNAKLGGQGARPPFKASARPSKSWPRAGSASSRPGGKPGGRRGGQPGKPPSRFRGGKPSGKKPGA
jgi:translation initiation factor IF-2